MLVFLPWLTLITLREKLQAKSAHLPLTLRPVAAIPPLASGDVLQGAAADCNSAGETHAWFDSRVAHHPTPHGIGGLI